jgi:hypothetical protein
MPPNPIEMPTWRPLFISFFILWHWHMYLWEILRYLFFYEPSIQQNPTVELPWSNTKFLWGSTTKYQGGTQQILINIFKFKKGTWVQVSHHYPMCHRHDKTCTVPSIRGDDWNSDLNNLRPPHETARSRKIGELRIKVVRASPVATLDPSLPYLYRLVSSRLSLLDSQSEIELSWANRWSWLLSQKKLQMGIAFSSVLSSGSLCPCPCGCLCHPHQWIRWRLPQPQRHHHLLLYNRRRKQQGRILTAITCNRDLKWYKLNPYNIDIITSINKYYYNKIFGTSLRHMPGASPTWMNRER